jgi:hypothetical protein
MAFSRAEEVPIVGAFEAVTAQPTGNGAGVYELVMSEGWSSPSRHREQAARLRHLRASEAPSWADRAFVMAGGHWTVPPGRPHPGYGAVVPQTYWDLSLQTRSESWRRVRSLRAQPPIGVLDDRRLLFAAALEQAEQQFLAAAAIGVQSRPLNLFYGLSQAGRALAAALAPAHGSPFVSGHGIRCLGLRDAVRDPLNGFPGIQVRSEGAISTSFRTLSNLLNSAPLDSAVRLGDLWAMLVEPHLHERLEHHDNPVLIMSARQNNDDTLLVTVVGLRCDFEATDLSDLSRLYPALEGMAFKRVSGMSAGSAGEETCSVELVHRGGHTDSVGFDYRGSRVILPAVGIPPMEIHPLMVWWAILYALSMLARYHPEAWTILTDVDRSEFAVPIEYLLDVAQDSVPDVLWRTLIAAGSR